MHVCIIYVGKGWLYSLCLLLKAITPKYHHLGDGVGKHLNIWIWEGVSLFSVDQVISPVIKEVSIHFLEPWSELGSPDESLFSSYFYSFHSPFSILEASM